MGKEFQKSSLLFLDRRTKRLRLSQEIDRANKTSSGHLCILIFNNRIRIGELQEKGKRLGDRAMKCSMFQMRLSDWEPEAEPTASHAETRSAERANTLA